ncbi:BQ5605_C019g09002 [Microbotryum silenes-dioicae]|uniref:BQ5605_C019g09002 protein n=1 Tax=Microbotryum silenes-dioicae TaxID=796604 RepID=A0A2X0NZP4_9BASI|nr:BQ5605_C019g09002 [Microbotryum silenes-dioicae]
MTTPLQRSKKPLGHNTQSSTVSVPSKKRSTSPTKRANLTGNIDDLLAATHLDGAGGGGESKSRRSSPVKSSSSLAAGGGIGRSGVVSHDWQGPAASSSAHGPNGDPRRSPSKKSRNLDRYIPSRANSSTGNGDHTGPILLPNGTASANNTGNYTNLIADNNDTAELSSTLGIDSSRRILSFFAEPPMPQTDTMGLLANFARLPNKGSAASSTSSANAQTRRRIATAPERVLDAPGLVDDYYLNLLDWSVTNLVAIGLGESVYVWNAESGEVNLLCSVGNASEGVLDEGDEYVCSVKFTEDGTHLAVGLSSGPIQVYDVQAGMLVRTMSGHLSRVPSLSWSGAILSSGCRTGEIWNSDVRVGNHCVAQMRGHRGEVCGLEWRPEIAGGLSGGGQGLLASGGNDNVVNVWDGRMTSAPKMCKTNHTAAVKARSLHQWNALAWCPWNSSILASGGGSSDRTIHFWNTASGARLNSLVTPSQVTSLVFSPHSREIMSSHGIPDHQLSIWAYPSLTKVSDIPQAHETRILHSCLSPDGTTVATASSDENLKFWKVFDVRRGVGKEGVGGRSLSGKDLEDDHGIQRKGKTGISVR